MVKLLKVGDILTKVIAFSNSGLQSLPHDDIDILSSTIIVNGIEEYLEGLEIKSQELSQRLKVSKNLKIDVKYPHLSNLADVIDSSIKKGYDSFLFVVGVIEELDLSPKIDMTKKQYPMLDIRIFQTESLGYISAYLALEAKNMFKEGLSLDETISKLDIIKYNSNIYYLEKARFSKFNIYKVESSSLVKINKKMKLSQFEVFIRNEINDDTISPIITHFDEDDSLLQQLNKLAYFKRAKKYYMAPSVRFYFKNKAYGFGYISKLNKG